MEKLPQDPNCPLLGTRYCRMLNMRACDKCAVRGSTDAEAVKRDLDAYEQLLPSGGVAKLFQTKECRFCRTLKKGRRSGYAIMDMAHPAPQSAQRWAEGKRIRATGTMIPLQMSICHDCRSRFLQAEYIPILVPLLISAVSLILCAAGPIHGFLAARAAILPFAAWTLVSLGAILLGCRMRKRLVHKFDLYTRMDVMEDPVVVEMLQKGWVPIGKRTGSRLLFSKSRMARGLGTATDEIPGETAEDAEPKETN